MKKLVNVHAKIPVRNIKPAMFGSYRNIELTDDTIFTLMCGRAEVTEILDDGTLLPLNFNNYNKNNNPKTEPVKNEEKKIPHIKEVKKATVKDPEPVEDAHTIELEEAVEPKEQEAVIDEEPVADTDPGIEKEANAETEEEVSVEEPVKEEQPKPQQHQRPHNPKNNRTKK